MISFDITGISDICYVRQGAKLFGDAFVCIEKHIGDLPFAVLLGYIITKT